MYSFLIGFGAGFTLALLFAPNSGETARGYLGSKASEGADFIKRQTGEARESALDMMDRGRDVVIKQVERLVTMQSPTPTEVYHR